MTGTKSKNRGTSHDLETRLAPVGEALKEALQPVVLEAVGGVLRPSRLVSALGLDKSLASRLVQALRCDDPLEFLHRIPAPTGLRILVDAARRKGISADACLRLDHTIEGFLALIDGTPGGRSGLDALISAHSSAARQRNEHRAKQAIFKATSYLLGCQCDTMATTLVLQPSADGRYVDGFELHQRLGLQRLRPSAPVALFSLNLKRGLDNGEQSPWIETLDGEVESDDPTRFLLVDSESNSMPGLEIVTREQHTIFALAEDDIFMDESLNLNSAYLIRHGWHRFAKDGIKDDARSYLLNYPCKTLVREVFVRDDLWVGSNPEINLQLPNPAGTDDKRYEGFLGRVNTVDLDIPIEQIGHGLKRTNLPELPRHKALLEDSFARAGWDPDRFQGYRARVVYPVPMITMGWWFRLPDPPKETTG